MRLRAANGAQIEPSEFIPVAEQTGLIHDLGIKAIEQSIAAAATWPDQLFVSVNLSAEQFRREDLATRIKELLEAKSFNPARLELEVTETVLLQDEERVADQLYNLKQLGVTIAMDDFGTGYSSLGYLWRYKFDKLKIDRVFLEGFDFDPERNGHLIETILLLGHKLGLKVTAEGVESASQSAALQAMGCDQMQGFYFGRPMTAAEASTLVGRPEEQSKTATRRL